MKKISLKKPRHITHQNIILKKKSNFVFHINEKGRFGLTALRIASEHNSKETVEVLLSHGTNISSS